MINQGTWVGRLTAAPDLRYTPNGKAVAKFTLACQRPFKNQNNEHDADFIPVEIWGQQAENAANTLSQGDIAGAPGRVQTSSKTDASGNRQFYWVVVADRVQFIKVKKWEESGPNGAQTNQGNTNAPGGNQKPNTGQYGANSGNENEDPFANEGEQINISDDDLPF